MAALVNRTGSKAQITFVKAVLSEALRKEPEGSQGFPAADDAAGIAVQSVAYGRMKAFQTLIRDLSDVHQITDHHLIHRNIFCSCLL